MQIVLLILGLNGLLHGESKHLKLGRSTFKVILVHTLQDATIVDLVLILIQQQFTKEIEIILGLSGLFLRLEINFLSKQTQEIF
jgi:hypothetical protein